MDFRPNAIENFQNNLECPVLMPNTLIDAVLLAPCGHSIGEVALKAMYKDKVEIDCPLCRERVTAWFPNRSLRSIVGQALDLVPSIKAVSEKQDPIPFPGKKARFIHVHGNWEVLDSGTHLAREMNFQSTTCGSLFEEITILGCKNGTVSILIKFLGKEETISYLNQCGVQAPSQGSKGSYRSNAYDTKALWSVIATHNEIPKNKVALLRELIYVGDWKIVTPLTAEDKALLERPYIRKVPFDAIPPGKKAFFVVTSKDWEDVPNGTEVLKKLELTSVEVDSYLKKITFLGLSDGYVNILISFAGGDKTISYLNRSGLDVPTKNSFNSGFRYSDHCFQSYTPNETQLLWNIISRNNYIPEKTVQLIRNLVFDQKCQWRNYQWIDHAVVLGTDFIHTGGNWEVFDSETEILRKLEFTSVSLNPNLLKEIAILGFKDGSVAISLKFLIKTMVFDFLNQFGMELSIDEELDYYTKQATAHSYQSTPENTKKLFAIIANHKLIPEEHFPLVNKLIESGDWRKVTPLENNEPAFKKRKID